MEHSSLIRTLNKWKLPLLVLLFGLVLMLMPKAAGAEREAADPDSSLQEILCRSKGVGQTLVLISDSGVVVVCAGAEDPRVRLDIIRAVGSYTGFGSDRITILKLAETS